MLKQDRESVVSSFCTFLLRQDYKEAFSKSDIFTCLLRLVMEGLDNEAGET